MMKKFISLALALVMVFSMATLVSASGGNSITGNGIVSGTPNGVTIRQSNGSDGRSITLTINATAEAGEIVMNIVNQGTFRFDTATPVSREWTNVSNSSSTWGWTPVETSAEPRIVSVDISDPWNDDVRTGTSFGEWAFTGVVEVLGFTFLANQRQLSGPNANFVNLRFNAAYVRDVIGIFDRTVKQTVTTEWSDGRVESVNKVLVDTHTVTRKVCEQPRVDENLLSPSQALPNGSANNLRLVFAGDYRLADVNAFITYNGNNNNGRAVLTIR